QVRVEHSAAAGLVRLGGPLEQEGSWRVPVLEEPRSQLRESSGAGAEVAGGCEQEIGLALRLGKTEEQVDERIVVGDALRPFGVHGGGIGGLNASKCPVIAAQAVGLEFGHRLHIVLLVAVDSL